MSNVVEIVITGIASYGLSILTTAFIVGVKWGKLNADVDNIKTDLAEIKGMFRLTLKD